MAMVLRGTLPLAAALVHTIDALRLYFRLCGAVKTEFAKEENDQ